MNVPLISDKEQKRWYVMRDLKRPNAKVPAYKQLENKHIEVFTPMKWCMNIKNGKRVREQVPFIQDLLFVHDTRTVLDPLVREIKTLQYRFQKGFYCRPMIVPDNDMDRFIYAVSVSTSPKYFLPGELTLSMYGCYVRIIGGPLDGFEGILQAVRGSKEKRLIVDLPSICSVSVEVKPEYIQLVN